MKLKALLKHLPQVEIKGPREIQLSGVCADSRLIAPGNLYIARKGSIHDGSHHIPDAIAAGATAILTDLYDPSLKQITQLIHPNISSLEATLAAEFYSHPSRELFAVGVTGTNGKTTTAYLVRHLLESAHAPCGLMGSIEQIVGPQRYRASRTTPGVTIVHKLLRDMVRSGCQAVVMEVTSHGLDQGRVHHVDFDVGIFTNLSQDHLDYHETMEAYAAAKARLFQQVKHAVVNADDPAHQTILSDFSGPVLTFGFSSNAQLRAAHVDLSLTGSQFQLIHGDETAEVKLPLIGRFNIANALAAVGAGLVWGASLQDLASKLSSAPCVRGRLESIPNKQNLRVLVDYAHTPDALAQVLMSLQEMGMGRILTVFGCGGGRDVAKRPEMGRIASQFSDELIITNDNPRHEDPQAIVDQIIAGIPPQSKWELCLDRRQAIAQALSRATPNDVVLIAGKGHETHQIIAQRAIPLDDRQIVQEILA